MLTDKEKNKEEIVDMDIDLSQFRKKRFRIDGDDNKILELNVSDLNILQRLNEKYPELIKLAQDAAEQFDAADMGGENVFEDGTADNISKALSEIDTKMREAMDYIFQANVSELCADNGSMYDPFNGQFRFEHIIEVLSGLYEQNLTKEIKQMTNRVNKRTSKYTKRSSK